jgi:hypothetical protein
VQRVLAVMVVAALAAAAGFWVSLWKFDAAKAEFAAAYAGRRPPHLIAGLRLRIPELTKAIPGLAATDGRGVFNRRLVLVTSDACRFCLEVVPAWCAQLQHHTFQPTEQIVAVSIDGRAIPERLLACAQGQRVAVAAAEVLDVGAFGARTGILSTPYMVLMDADWRIVRTYTRPEMRSPLALTQHRTTLATVAEPGL